MMNNSSNHDSADAGKVRVYPRATRRRWHRDGQDTGGANGSGETDSNEAIQQMHEISFETQQTKRWRGGHCFNLRPAGV